MFELNKEDIQVENRYRKRWPRHQPLVGKDVTEQGIPLPKRVRWSDHFFHVWWFSSRPSHLLAHNCSQQSLRILYICGTKFQSFISDFICVFNLFFLFYLKLPKFAYLFKVNSYFLFSIAFCFPVSISFTLPRSVIKFN